MLVSRGHQAQQYLSEKQAQDPRFVKEQIVVPTLSFSDRFVIHGGDLTLEFHRRNVQAMMQLLRRENSKAL